MPSLLLAILLAADAVIYDAAVRTEGRTGSAPNDPRGSASTGQLDGFVSISAKYDNVTVSGSYTPRLVETPPPEGSGLAVVHGFRVGLEYRTSGSGHVLLQELGSFGRNDFSPLVANVATGAGPPRILDPHLPVKALLAIIDSDTSVAVDQALTRRTTVHGSVGWLISGGADSIAQRYIPLQRGPHASGGISWTATRFDRLSLSSSASLANFTNGSQARLLTMNGGWNHDFDPTTRFEMGVGSGIGETRGTSAGGAPTPFPWVSASLSHDVKVHRGSVSGSVRASAAPQVDRTSGDVYELANASATLTWTLERVMRVSGSGGFGRALSGPNQVGSQLITAELSASFPFAALSAFALGGRGAWQSIPPTTPGVLAAPGFDWAVFASILVGAHGTL